MNRCPCGAAGRRPGLLALLLIAGLGMAACGSDNPVEPTDPAPLPVTETFSGILNINGAVTYPFLATASGTVNLTLNSLDPNPENTRIGLALGTWNGTVCQIILANDSSFVSTVVTGANTAAAFLCARVSDVGKITANTTFSVTIEHP
jgi:hypothetical protein